MSVPGVERVASNYPKFPGGTKGSEFMSKVWFITGGGRGMGTDIARAALDAGYKVVATGRNTDSVVQAVGPSENL